MIKRYNVHIIHNDSGCGEIMDKYTVLIIPKLGNPMLTFGFEDCTQEHALRLVEINERVWNDEATISMIKQ